MKLVIDGYTPEVIQAVYRCAHESSGHYTTYDKPEESIRVFEDNLLCQIGFRSSAAAEKFKSKILQLGCQVEQFVKVECFKIYLLSDMVQVNHFTGRSDFTAGVSDEENRKFVRRPRF